MTATLRGEEYLLGLLLQVVLANITLMGRSVPGNTDALDALAEAGLIDVRQQTDGSAQVVLLPDGQARLDRMAADKTKPTA